MGNPSQSLYQLYKSKLYNITKCLLYCIVSALQLYTQAKQVLSTLDPEQQAEQVTELAQRLVQVTRPLSNKSLLPNDLGTSAMVVADVIRVLENSNSTNEVMFSQNLIALC